MVETLSTINNTSLPKSPSESVQYPLSRMQQKKCMFVNQLMAEAMMEMVEESEVHIRVQQQLETV